MATWYEMAVAVIREVWKESRQDPRDEPQRWKFLIPRGVGDSFAMSAPATEYPPFTLDPTSQRSAVGWVQGIPVFEADIDTQFPLLVPAGHPEDEEGCDAPTGG